MEVGKNRALERMNTCFNVIFPSSVLLERLSWIRRLRWAGKVFYGFFCFYNWMSRGFGDFAGKAGVLFKEVSLFGRLDWKVKAFCFVSHAFRDFVGNGNGNGNGNGRDTLYN